jgi:hypothetical protein
MQQMLSGAIAAGWAIAGLFFCRFWWRSGDRFFLWFALSFWLEAINRVALGLFVGTEEDSPLIYGLRVVSYGFILYAIWQKNRPRS